KDLSIVAPKVDTLLARDDLGTGADLGAGCLIGEKSGWGCGRVEQADLVWRNIEDTTIRRWSIGRCESKFVPEREVAGTRNIFVWVERKAHPPAAAGCRAIFRNSHDVSRCVLLYAAGVSEGISRCRPPLVICKERGSEHSRGRRDSLEPVVKIR